DDLWPADKLESQITALHQNSDVVMVYGRVACIDANDNETIPLDERGEPVVLPWETPTGDVYNRFIRQNWIISPGQCLIRATALRSLGRVPIDPDPELRGCDDWDLWCRLAETGTFLFQNHEVLRYRFHAGNASRNTLQMHRATLKV